MQILSKLACMDKFYDAEDLLVKFAGKSKIRHRATVHVSKTYPILLALVLKFHTIYALPVIKPSQLID